MSAMLFALIFPRAQRASTYDISAERNVWLQSALRSFAIVCDYMETGLFAIVCDLRSAIVCDPRSSAIVCDHMETRGSEKIFATETSVSIESTAFSGSWANLPSGALPLLPLSKEIWQYNLKVTKRCAKYGSSLRYVARQILECKIAWQNICHESMYFCFPLLLRLKSTISRNVGIG